jgi:small subunit ribosomal protein S5
MNEDIKKTEKTEKKEEKESSKPTQVSKTETTSTNKEVKVSNENKNLDNQKEEKINPTSEVDNLKKDNQNNKVEDQKKVEIQGLKPEKKMDTDLKSGEKEISPKSKEDLQVKNEEKQKKLAVSRKKYNGENKNKTNSSYKNQEQNEFVEKLVSINRVAKVVKGGRRFSFAALVVVGDGNGMVGHGKGKAKEVPEAIKKATEEAKNKMIRVPLRQGRTLHHDIQGRFDSGNVYLRSAPSGTGVIAGGPMRAIFEALGIQDIVAKSVGTSNPHNMIRATFEALKLASSPKIIAVRRGLKINEITKRRKVSQGNEENAKN